MKNGTDKNWYIENIIQNVRIDVMEDGTEAAAVTANVFPTEAYYEDPSEPEEIKEFIADKPFSFMIISDFSGEGR